MHSNNRKGILNNLFCIIRISSPYTICNFLSLFVFATKYGHPISLSLPDLGSQRGIRVSSLPRSQDKEIASLGLRRGGAPALSDPSLLSLSLFYCQFIERAICWCASPVAEEPDALSDPQWLAPVRHTGGSSTGMLGRSAVAHWHPTTPQLSKPTQLTAYLHRATAYKDTSTQKTFNQVQMRYTGKQSVLILCATMNQKHWRPHTLLWLSKERCYFNTISWTEMLCSTENCQDEV